MQNSEHSSAEALKRVQDVFESGQSKAAASLLLQVLKDHGYHVDLVRYGAWLFSTLGDEANAFECLNILFQFEKLSDAQNALLASYCFHRKSMEKALDHIAYACEGSPQNVSYAVLRSTIIQHLGNHQDAVSQLLRFMREHGQHSDIFLQISNICLDMGEVKHALLGAERAWQLTPHVPAYRMHYAALLMEQKEFGAVKTVLAAEDFPLDDQTLYMLSISAAQLHQYDEALLYIEDAVKQRPERSELLMHMGAVLCCLMRYQDSVEIFENVLRMDPHSAHARKACFAAMSEAGMLAQATSMGGSIIANDPFDDRTGRSLQHILTRRFVNLDEGHGGGEAFLKRKTEFLALNPRAERTRISPVSVQIRVIGALLLREMRTRFGRSRLGYMWAIFEPLAHILVMVSIISLMAHSSPPIGDHFAVFYFTGIIPYQLFLHTVGQMMSGVPANRPLLQLPPVNTLDVYFSRALLEITTTLAVSSLFIVGFLAFGLKALPINPIGVLAALIILWLTAIGIGMMNAIIATFFDGWERIWSAVISIIYFTSGTFYIPRIMPERIRDVLVWNPVLQAIEMVRVNYFHEPNPPWLDVPYMCSLALICITMALVLERIYRRRILDIE